MIIQDFNGHQVRTEIKNGEPWFVAKDIANIIGIQNIRTATVSLKANQKDVSLIYTLGGTQEMTIVNEAGLYKLNERI